MEDLNKALERAVMAQQEATSAVESIRELIEKQVEEYDVVTPVSNRGRVIFDNNTQVLGVINGRLVVEEFSSYADGRANFKWVPCKREDLVAGDVAYVSDSDRKEFKHTHLVKTIIDSENYWTAENTGVNKGYCHGMYWYKLTLRS